MVGCARLRWPRGGVKHDFGSTHGSRCKLLLIVFFVVFNILNTIFLIRLVSYNICIVGETAYISTFHEMCGPASVSLIECDILGLMYFIQIDRNDYVLVWSISVDVCD